MKLVKKYNYKKIYIYLLELKVPFPQKRSACICQQSLKCAGDVSESQQPAQCHSWASTSQCSMGPLVGLNLFWPQFSGKNSCTNVKSKINTDTLIKTVFNTSHMRNTVVAV